VKRAERHHLKQDELVQGIDRATQWTLQNQKNILNVAFVVVGAALLLGGLYVYRTRQAETAAALLTEALSQFHGAVGPSADTPANVPTFETNEERYRTALESFQKVGDEYSSYDAGRHARYYAGLCHAGLKDFDAAAEALSELRSGKRDLLYYLSSRALAGVKSSQKDHAAAAEIYRLLVEDPENPLAKDELLYELGRSEERAGNVAEARQYYDRLVAEHPDSQLRGDAMTRSEAIAFETRSGAGGG
jgi:tetratricopeptide (TPR) repeat protein